MLPAVDVRETLRSWVYLSGDRAYKLRKPLRFPLVDQSTARARRALAMQELRLNQDLAPATYLGIRSVTTPGGEDVAVEMRRFDEANTLAGRLQTGRAHPSLLAELGRHLAQHHASLPSLAEGGAAATLAHMRRNAAILADARGSLLSASRLGQLLRPLELAALRHADALDARAAGGAWREGHGALRAAHIVVDERGTRIVDRLEFDRDLRVGDVGCDLASLLMDLDALGHQGAADTILAAYREAGGDPGSDELLAMWSAQRATESITVALLRAAQPGGERALDNVRALVVIAERLA